MQKKYIENTKRILNQFWWPINIDYKTFQITNITQKLVDFHIENIENIENYSKSEIYSLYWIIKYAINDLWEDEFSTVTWLDLYNEWYTTLNYIKSLII
jgi:hypothetical protein